MVFCWLEARVRTERGQSLQDEVYGNGQYGHNSFVKFFVHECGLDEAILKRSGFVGFLRTLLDAPEL